MRCPRIAAGLLAAGLFVVVSSTPFASELLVNGGFETGNFSGWTTTPASSGSNFGVQNFAPHSGTFNARFGATTLGFFDTISQTVPTIPGALYQVSFWLRSDGTGPNEFDADFGGNRLDTFGQGPYPYGQYVYPKIFLDGFDHADAHYTVATSTSTVLQFRAYHLPSFWRLDDVSVMRICDPGLTGSQQFFAGELPLAIPVGRTGGDVLFRDEFVTGTGTTFVSTPQSTSAAIYVCIDDVLPQNLKVIARPLGDAPDSAVLVLWDHEQFLDPNTNLPVQHIEALANLPFAGLYPDPGSNPPTYSYKIKVLDDEPGTFHDFNGNLEYLGSINSSVLILNPSSPGHLGLPIVNLYADEMFHPIPLSIEFGEPLTVFATAIGNPASYKITRLGLKVKERVDIDPLNPNPNNLLLPYQQHNTGIGPGIYTQADVAQSPSSTTGVGLNFEPPDLPILPPGYYEVTATAWDNAGFTRSLTQHLTVDRSFGFLSVANLVRQVNTACDEEGTNNGLPCNTANFNATLNLINNTPNNSGSLRVRLVSVPGFAATDDTFSFINLPAEQDLAGATIGPVAQLLGCSAQQVEVCGLIPAPQQFDGSFGIGFQVYAVLEECDGTAVQCADPNLPDLWTTVDTIRVTEGEWPVVDGFNGPGGGTNQDRRGGRGRNDPFVLDSVTILPATTTVPDGGSVQYHADATLKKSSGATKTLNSVRVQWSTDMFTVSSTGLFQAGHVTADTPVHLMATFTYAGVTRTNTLDIVVKAPGSVSAAMNPDKTRRQSAVATVDTAAVPSMNPLGAAEMTSDDGEMNETDRTADNLKRRNKPPKPPKISIGTAPINIMEGGIANINVLANKVNPTNDVTVNYSVSGSAVLNKHFTLCGTRGQITIPAGATSASLRLNAIANDQNVGSETAIITLLPNAAYKLPKRHSATVNITNRAAPLCP